MCACGEQRKGGRRERNTEKKKETDFMYYAGFLLVLRSFITMDFALLFGGYTTGSSAWSIICTGKREKLVLGWVGGQLSANQISRPAPAQGPKRGDCVEGSPGEGSINCLVSF